MELTDRDRAILDFEATWWEEPGPGDALVADHFDLAAAHDDQPLNELPDSDDADSPLLVRRLRRLRPRCPRLRQHVLQAGERPAR